MSDESSPSPIDVGQVETAPWSQGQAESSPAPQEGPAPATQSSQDPGQADQPQANAEPSFFDPNNLAPELLPAYKQMQAAFTTKTQDIARQRQKVEAYDAFMRDPVGQIQQLATQYGLSISRQQAAQQEQQTQDWQPQTWEEVLTRAKAVAKEEIMQEMAPYLGQVQQMHASNIEKQLSSIDPDWRKYEGNMQELMQAHPTLVKDVSKLYRLAVPPEVLEAKAIQQALNRYEKKGQHAAVTSGQSTAPKSQPTPAKISSFDEAYRDAKRRLLSGEK